MRVSENQRIWLAAAALVALGLALPAWARFIVVVALGKGVAALGLIVLLRTGLLSFGQGLFFCVGAYAAGLLSRYWQISDFALVLACGIAVSTAMAMVLGLLVARYRGIFFALLTMAFSMVLYGALVKLQALGGTDGFNVAPPTFFGLRPESAEAGRDVLYACAVALSVIASLGTHRYLASPLGRFSEAVRDAEVRVEYLGISGQQLIYRNYLLAAALAGAGGAIVGVAVGHVDPGMSYWTTSGEFVLIAILGGTASVLAPFVGALIFSVLHHYAFEFAPLAWQIVVGLVLLLIVKFLPDGIWNSLFKPKEA